MRFTNLLTTLAAWNLSNVAAVAAATTSWLAGKSVVEYPLPAAGQTHEILAVSDELLLISQQTDGSLLKVALNQKGQPIAARKYTIASPWSGLHGLALHSSPDTDNVTVWATAQFDNTVLQVDPNGNDINSPPRVLRTIPIPAPAGGPHGILEHDGNLWAACKDSSHVVRLSINNPDADHQVWAVSGRPIFTAVHPTSGDIFSGLDTSSKIWHYKNDGGKGEEISVPPEKGSLPVGTVAGPDKNVWVALLGNSTTGTGTFGRINADATIDWFSLSSDLGKTAPLIHMAFNDKDPSQLYLLGSSTVCRTCIDAVFIVKIEDTSGGTASPRIAVQNTIMLPTQRSWTHRMLSHRGHLYVTELTTSSLAHISGGAVVGLNVSETWDQYAFYGRGAPVEALDYSGMS